MIDRCVKVSLFLVELGNLLRRPYTRKLGILTCIFRASYSEQAVIAHASHGHTLQLSTGLSSRTDG